MSKGWLLVGALAIAGAGYTVKGGCLQETTKAPDERLATRLDELCVIAKDNVSTPERGVRKLGGYMVKHTGDILADWGNTFAAIEKIRDDAKHDDRARLARDRIRRPVHDCAVHWARFFDAVDKNPAAKQLVDQFNVRFNRTLEILFGDGASLDLLRHEAVEHLLEGRVDVHL
jgi:hypothetical protein